MVECIQVRKNRGLTWKGGVLCPLSFFCLNINITSTLSMKIASNLHIIYYPSSFAPTLIDWKLVIGFKMWITKPEISWCLNQCNNKYRVQLSALAPTTSFATFWAFLKNNKVSYVLKILQAHIFSTSTSSESDVFLKKTTHTISM